MLACANTDVRVSSCSLSPLFMPVRAWRAIGSQCYSLHCRSPAQKSQNEFLFIQYLLLYHSVGHRTRIEVDTLQVNEKTKEKSIR